MLIGSIQLAFSQWAIGWTKDPSDGWLYHNKGVTLGDSVYPHYKLLITNKAAGEENIFMQIANTILTGSLATDGFLVGLNGINAILNQQEDADIIFKTNATDRAVIKNNGYVGIGIMDPKHNLHVHGTGTTGGGTSGGGLSTTQVSSHRNAQTDNKSLPIGHITPTAYGAIQITNNTTGTSATDGLLIEVRNNSAAINLQERGSISFRNSGKTCMQISPENNLKIGKITNITDESKVGIFSAGQNGLLVTTVNNPDGYIFKARNSSSSNALVVKGDGKVGIGTDNTQGHKLAVKGTVIAEEIFVKEASDWPDFVFNKNYKILPLNKLESFIIRNKHLPGIPTEAEVKENGIKLGVMNKLLLQKVEELTLYIIQQQKEIETLKREIVNLKK